MSISTFFGLETALRGILAQQRALDVTAHNISNANTVGYTPQAAPSWPPAGLQRPRRDAPPQAGQIGTGVDVQSYRRVRDEFVDVQLRAQTTRQGSTRPRATASTRSSSPSTSRGDTGLNSLLDKYWARGTTCRTRRRTSPRGRRSSRRGGRSPTASAPSRRSCTTIQSQTART